MTLPARRARLAIITVAAALAAAATGLRPLTAQSPAQAVPTQLSSDSTAWQRVLTHIVEVLGGTIVRAAAEPSPQPWQIRVPPDEPQRSLLERQLKTILRARPVSEADSVVYALELGALRVVKDTARVTVRFDVAQYCAGSAMVAGYVNLDSIYVARAPQGFWGVARTVRVVHGDRLPCPRPKR